MADTRKDKRAPVSLKVRFKSATVDEFIEHYSKDVSRGGIFIKSSQPMPVGTLLKFQFQLKDESALIKGVGRVVWTRAEDRAAADQPAGMGIKFIKMDGDSRGMVDRIVDAHSGGPGAFESGRDNASDSEGQGDGFFPEVGPAQLPPPEDRTAVRQAAQFLAAALSEAGTDQAAAREAEQKAEEARRRTAQIEAQRSAEAEHKKQSQRAPEPLPSMIIDPALSEPPPGEDRPTNASPPRAPTQEQATAKAPKPMPPPAPAALPPAPPPAALAPPAPKPAPVAASSEKPTATATATQAAASAPKPEAPRPVSSAPPPAPAAPKRSPVMPIAAIAAVLGVAAFVALRGGPEPAPSAASAPVVPEPAVQQPTPAPEPAAPEPAPEPAPVEPAPTTAEPAPQPEPEPAPAVPVELVPLKVVSVPPGAEVLVNGDAKGPAPVTLELPKDVAITLSARAPGFAASSQEVTPGPKTKVVRVALTALPCIVHVETTPPGAAIVAGAKRGTSPVDLVLAKAPTAVLRVSAKLVGYELASTELQPDAFAESGDALRASVNLTLTALPEPPVPALKPKPVAKPKPEEGVAPTGAPTAPAAPPDAQPAAKPEPAAAPKPEPAAAPKPEPAAAPKPEQAAKPEPEPAAPAKPNPPSQPAETIPDNPFG